MGTEIWLDQLIFAHAFQSKEKSILAGRRLATLQGGNIARVPPMTQAGDIIYRINRGSPLRECKGKFVFRALDGDAAKSATANMSALLLAAFHGFREELEFSLEFGKTCISKEIKHCIRLGQCRMFGEGFEEPKYSVLAVH